MLITGNFSAAKSLIDAVSSGHARLSFSQFAEDLIIQLLLHDAGSPGFYVDVGAHHPQRFSNTYNLHQKGWRGINIDGDPASIELFNEHRPTDINVNAFVSNAKKTVEFHRFDESAVNTISDVAADHYKSFWNEVSTAPVETRTLEDILDEQLPPGQSIDLLSVDAEGVDYDVLCGNNWDVFRPKLLVVEVDGLNLMSASSHRVVEFMASKTYEFVSFVHQSAFFLRRL